MCNEKLARCKRCGRKLTNPESIKAGYGKTCLRRIERTKATPPKANVSEIEELRQEIQQLKMQMHNMQLPQMRNSLPQVPSNGNHNKTTIALSVVAGMCRSLKRTNFF